MLIFSSIATDEKSVIDIFNVGAGHMRGHVAAEALILVTPADISDSDEAIACAKAMRVELGASIRPGFEALLFKASGEIEEERKKRDQRLRDRQFYTRSLVESNIKHQTS